MSPTVLALSLQLCKGIGGQTAGRVLMRNELLQRTPQQFLKFSAAVLMEEYRFTEAVAERFCAERNQLVSQAETLHQTLLTKGVRTSCPLDALYPQQLEAFLPNPPGLIFFYGNLGLLSRKKFAVMSSRKSPLAYQELIERLVEEGVERAEVLVSGHDTAEYQRGAVVPMRWGAPRILVLDMGMFAALGENLDEEPFRAARLWRYKFDPHTDLVVSAINPVWVTHPAANRNRDQLIAALADRVDFGCVREGGNMERALFRCIELGKPVRLSDLNSQASEAQRRGAELIEF